MIVTGSEIVIAMSSTVGPVRTRSTGGAWFLPKLTATVSSSAESSLQTLNSPESSVRTSATTRLRCNTPVRSPTTITLALGSGTPVSASVTMPPMEVSPVPVSAEHQAARMVSRDGTAR